MSNFILNLATLSLRLCFDMCLLVRILSSHIHFNININTVSLFSSLSAAVTNHLFSSSVYVDKGCFVRAFLFGTALFLATLFL